MYNLKIIVASTRPGRKGPIVADWIYEVLKANPSFSTELLDLAVINLPFFDETNHPRLQKYEHQHTKDWSAIIDKADAFIIVTPEYNFGYPATIKNALDFLYNEWCYKPVAFVSYGGLAAGTRCIQMLKQVVTAQKMMPVTDAVNIPFFTNHINDDHVFVPGETITKSAEVMVAELLRWTEALKPMRNKQG
ncbi:MAG: NAD(P)H-dependent oxidoreductase [Ferruginibacter sp.]|nr:NAD(P)H-dependent oxidoreductase [Ferruginibacter sp.]